MIPEHITKKLLKKFLFEILDKGLDKLLPNEIIEMVHGLDQEIRKFDKRTEKDISDRVKSDNNIVKNNSNLIP